MEHNYNYLKKFLPHHQEIKGLVQNTFYPINSAEIELGFNFPSELREFYQVIGYGFLSKPYNAPDNFEVFDRNYLIPPDILINIYNRHPDNEIFDLDALEDLNNNDLPFFDIGDRCLFMTMKLDSDNPNAVWFLGHTKIEDSLKEFMWNLYYRGPSYYNNKLK